MLGLIGKRGLRHMQSIYTSKTILWKLLFGSLAVCCLLVLTPQQANAQEIGNVCVQDYKPGAVCTANDVRIKELRIVEVVKACNVAPDVGFLDVIFEALVSSEGSPDRYDIGLFLALDGGSALSGDSCYHDHLPPPITTSPVYGDKNGDGVQDIDNGPWWNGEPNDADTCGDLETNSQVYRLTQQIRIACTDIDQNGAADIHVCTSWDNQTDGNCNGVANAFPGTPSKCGCAVVNFDFTPTAITGISFSARSEGISPKMIYMLMGFLILGGLFAGYSGYRFYANQTT